MKREMEEMGHDFPEHQPKRRRLVCKTCAPRGFDATAPPGFEATAPPGFEATAPAGFQATAQSDAPLTVSGTQDEQICLTAEAKEPLGNLLKHRALDIELPRKIPRCGAAICHDGGKIENYP